MKFANNNLLLLIFFGVLVISGCRTKVLTPPPNSAPTLTQPTAQSRNLISIQIDEIALANPESERELDVNAIWIIPISFNPTDSQGTQIRLEYLEGNPIQINAVSSYRPSSPWFLSIERSDLNNEDFGLWFMVINTESSSEALREVFNQTVKDAAVALGAAGVSVLLASIPIPGDEIIAGTIAVSRGRALLGSAFALGRAGLRNAFAEAGTRLGDQTIITLADNLNMAAQYLDNVDYFSEAAVLLSANDSYFLDNQVSIVTTDGSLVIKFTVFATTNDPNTLYSAPNSHPFLLGECNPEVPSNLQSGDSARAARNLRALETPVDITGGEQMRLRQDDIVETIVSFCNRNVLWWRVRWNQNGEEKIGWVAESESTAIYLERVQ